MEFRAKADAYIDSLYNNYDIPKFYVREDEENPDIWWLIDGQQRLTAILGFLDDEFSSGDFSTLPKEIRNKLYSDLKPKQSRVITARVLSFVVLKCNDDEEEDLFLRLNKGTPLNAAEKRNAIQGDVRDLAIGLSEHKFFKSKISYSTKRYAGHAVCAQLIMLAMSGEPCDIKGRQLKELYENNKRLPNKTQIESQVKKVLNKLNKIFKDKEVYMKKYNIFSLFLFINELSTHYSLSGILDKDIYSFIDDFEIKRKANNQKSEDDAGFDRDLNQYTISCVNSPDSKEAVLTRHNLLMKRFFINNPQITTKDSNRNFSIEQKEAIYLLCNKRCQGGSDCPMTAKSIPFEDCEFDHIKEHTDGGTTCVENGQVLCQTCHPKKTAQSKKRRSISSKKKKKK